MQLRDCDVVGLADGNPLSEVGALAFCSEAEADSAIAALTTTLWRTRQSGEEATLHRSGRCLELTCDDPLSEAGELALSSEADAEPRHTSNLQAIAVLTTFDLVFDDSREMSKRLSSSV